MSVNLYLDELTKDLTVGTDYNLRLTADNSEYVSQKIENILKTYSEEWFLDYTIGIPYFDRILIKNADLDDVNNIFLTAISSIEEIDEVLDFSTELDRSERKYTVTFTAKLVDETIVEGEVTV